MERKLVAFNGKYFLLTVLLFLIEVIIALFIHDRYVRPYVGDLLVVVLIYCFFKSFFNIPALPTALAVLLSAYAVEVLQYVRYVEFLGLQHSRLANIILGNSFEWIDLLAYTIGVRGIIFCERITEG